MALKHGYISRTTVQGHVPICPLHLPAADNIMPQGVAAARWLATLNKSSGQSAGSSHLLARHGLSGTRGGSRKDNFSNFGNGVAAWMSGASFKNTAFVEETADGVEIHDCMGHQHFVLTRTRKV